MKISEKEWSSPSIGEKVKIDVFGTSGTPLLFFNAECDETGADEEFLKALEYQIINGLNLVYIIKNPDYKTIFDKSVSAKSRLIHYLHIESFITDELIPRMKQESANDFVMVAGIGEGAYLAMNMMLRHPSNFNKCISICGTYDMRPDFDGSVLEDFYYNNPVEYLPNLTDDLYLNEIRNTDLRIISHNEDENISQSERLSEQLYHKDVAHILDIWGSEEPMNKAAFQKMFAKHIP